MLVRFYLVTCSESLLFFFLFTSTATFLFVFAGKLVANFSSSSARALDIHPGGLCSLLSFSLFCLILLLLLLYIYKASSSSSLCKPPAFSLSLSFFLNIFLIHTMHSGGAYSCWSLDSWPYFFLSYSFFFFLLLLLGVYPAEGESIERALKKKATSNSVGALINWIELKVLQGKRKEKE